MSVGGTVAAAIAVFTGNPEFAGVAYAAGAGIESIVHPQQIEGPRLEDLRVQMSSYGAPIPFEYGTNRHAGTIIWPKIIELKESSQSESAKGGPETTTYSYSVSMAVLICEGPIAGVRRIWANKKLIYDVSAPPAPAPEGDPVDPGTLPPTSGEGAAIIDNAPSTASQDPAVSGIRFYLGTETQEPDPLIEATDGPSPAYLGYAYVVFEDLDLTDFANRPPMLEFEVLTIGSDELPDAESMGAAGGDAAIDPNTGFVWSVTGFANTHFEVYVTDNVSKTLIETIRWPETGTDSVASHGNSITYVDSTNEFWVSNESGNNIVAFNATTMALARIRNYSILPRFCLTTEPPTINWAGIVRYDRVHNFALIGQTNLGVRLIAVRPEAVAPAPDPCDSTKIIDPNFYPEWAVDVPSNGYSINFLEASKVNGLVLVITGKHVVILNGGNGAIRYDIESDDLGSTGNKAAYDSKRNVLLVVKSPSDYLLRVDATTGLLTKTDYADSDAIPPGGSITFRNILYHAQNDRYYVTAHEAGLGWTLYTIDPDTLEIVSARVVVGPTNTGTMIEVPGVTSYFGYADSGSGLAWRIPLGASLDPHPVVLGDIVADICNRAGLADEDIDVVQLIDDVDGYPVLRQMTGRAAIEPLQTAFFFDAVESDDKLKFVKRGAGLPILIPMEDRAAREYGADLPDSLSIVRAQDMELPVQVDVEYADIDADHLVGNQYSRRITKDTKQRVNIQSPVVMNATKAKQVADVTLYRAWLNQSYKFTTTRKWAHLEPTDVVILPTLEASYTARIVAKREQPNGCIEWDAAMESVEVYSQSGAGAAPTNYVKQAIYSPDATDLELLDIPMLRDADNDAGFYVAMG
jgi:hypothetical protein